MMNVNQLISTLIMMGWIKLPTTDIPDNYYLFMKRDSNMYIEVNINKADGINVLFKPRHIVTEHDTTLIPSHNPNPRCLSPTAAIKELITWE